ncbi:hypothetical protein HDU93_004901 [Gonapodya sp. JEL0774]|nr:hypothetical protein HDU93_004901 [Gonapodya sp. JEL0774]
MQRTLGTSAAYHPPPKRSTKQAGDALAAGYGQPNDQQSHQDMGYFNVPSYRSAPYNEYGNQYQHTGEPNMQQGSLSTTLGNPGGLKYNETAGRQGSAQFNDGYGYGGGDPSRGYAN